MKKNFAKSLITALALVTAVAPVAPSHAATALNWPTVDIDPGNQWAGAGAQTNTSDVYAFIDTGSVSLSPALNSVNIQFYGFEHPGPNSTSAISTLSRSLGGNKIQGTLGTFVVEIQGDSGNPMQPITFSPNDVQISWQPANGVVAAHLVVFVNNLGGFERGEIGFTIKANSLTTNVATTGRNIVLSGSSGNQGDNFYVGFKNYSSGNSQTPSSGGSLAAEPAKYSGPELSGLTALGVMHGSEATLNGKNLDEITGIEIGGKAATFSANSDSELSLNLPAGLAPGLYDLVINSPAGKLTHVNAIQVREPKRSFSITSRSVGRISEEQYQEHAIVSSMQIPELNKARCVVNAASLAQAKAQAQRLCALVKAANPNIETTIVEARSTVKNNSVYARVIYGWN